jgi:adenylate kinase family enzyme
MTLQTEICQNLVKEHSYINLDVTKLQSAEIDRKTSIGEELFKYATHDKIIPSSLIVRMLNKIIYCGQKRLNKFILSNFPEQIDQVKCFEEECAKISAIVYPTNQGATVEIT